MEEKRKNLKNLLKRLDTSTDMCCHFNFLFLCRVVLLLFHFVSCTLIFDLLRKKLNFTEKLSDFLNIVSYVCTI